MVWAGSAHDRTVLNLRSSSRASTERTLKPIRWLQVRAVDSPLLCVHKRRVAAFLYITPQPDQLLYLLCPVIALWIAIV